MKRKLHLTLLLLLAFVAQVTYAQAPTATPEEAVTALLNRIGGDGAAKRFEFVIDTSLAENGKDVFVITSQNGKPCIKGNTQLSVTTGINWYLNHYAHINLTWNNLTTDLSQVTLPVPAGEEKHVSNAKYRYDFNTCTFSYSMAFWTWDRWQKEIDWMALHGINAPLNLVGLDVVTRKFLRELGVSESDINAYIAGPGFIAWFAMNNLEGWGGTINSPNTGVNMSGNPDWWYTRQEQLCRNMLQRMRELGMQPVIPGFSGQVPNCIVNYSINGFSSGDVVNNGTWAGGYTRPDILKPNTESYRTFAAVYYKHLHEVMGVSELYSIDPFHEGSLPGGVTNKTCYPEIMKELDKHFGNVEQSVKDSYKVTQSPSWMIQYWQGVPQSGAFTAMKDAGYSSRFIGLDLFADNIYADNAAKWRTNYYDTCPYIYCMLHNFGGRSGLHGRLETTMDGYFQALAKNNNCQGIGATPEGTETNPILYDMLFELPWMDSNPGADAWLEEYAYSRYGVQNEKALSALKNLKESVWDCKVNQQGTSEAVILARPNWTIKSVSSWSTSAIYWDTQDILQAADELYVIKDIVTANGGQDGIANYNYDFIDVVRQSMVDYAAELLPLINAARGNDAEYTRLYQLYLQLMLDLDEMLSYDENFKLERWTSLARNIADEVAGTTENDRNWLEWNARTQVTVWSKGNTDLHDYSNRCWSGLIKDFHYKRWKHFFENNGNAPSGGWYGGFEYPWTVDFNNTYNLAGDYSKVVIPTDMTATEKAAETFGKYFGRVKGATKNYIFPMGIATNATKSDVIPEVYRGKTVELPLIIGKNVTITSVWIDLNADGNDGNGETLTAYSNKVTIPTDAKIGKTKAQVKFNDGTDITFSLALVEDISSARTVTAVASANGSVAIEGTNELSVTNTDAVKMTATANTGYNFENWTDAKGNVVSNDNPFIYYGKEDATFTANFIQDKWGVPSMTSGGLKAVKDNKQYVSQINFAYRGREAETIYDATSTAPTSLFTTIPQIINVPQGASFTISWTDNGSQNLTKCFLSAYMDFDGDGNFEEEGELVKVVGTRNADNASVRNGSFQVVLPYDAPTGITHLRMRFDSAWGNQYNSTTKAFNSKGELDRMCYEVVINVTEKSDKAATVNVETNNAEWGSVEVWTDETPDGSTGTEWVVSANIPMYLRATKASEDVEFLGWYDHYGRLLTNELEHTMYAREDATYTAKFRKFLEIDGWNIEYRTEGADIILTNVRKNGEGDLVIPETINILGEAHTVIGFDNGLFNNNKALTSITLPKSVDFLGSNSVFKTSLNGNITPSTGGDQLDSSKSQLIDLGGYSLDRDKVWTLNVSFKTEGKNSLYNKWGTILLSGGNNASNNQWLYLSANGNGYLRLPGFSSLFSDTQDANNYFYEHTNGKIATFTVSIANQGNGTAIVTVINSEGVSKSSSAVTFDAKSFTQLSSYITTGVNITKLEITEGEIPCAFSGCSNLDAIIVEAGSTTYSSIDGCLYNADGSKLLCTPEGKAKGADRRALGTLIKQMQSLTAQVGTFNPIGKDTEISLQTNEGTDYYIWCSNPHTSGNDGKGGVAALLDENADTYLHTNYTNVSASNDFLQVELGEGNELSQFKIAGMQRKGATDDFPKKIEIQGSTDKLNWENIAIVDNLTQKAGDSWNSEIISPEKKYSYLKFVVTTGTNRKFFHMAKFDLIKVSTSATLHKTFVGSALTADIAAEKYDVLLATTDVYDNGTTAQEMQDAKAELQTAYDALVAKINDVTSVKFTTDEANPVLYKIFIKRTADVTVLKYDESDKMIAVQNKADNNSWQAWYFMGSTNGITIHPYNADGMVLSADNTSNDPAKVWATQKGEKVFYEWLFIKRSDGYWNIQAHDKSNYFSNNGGTSNKMGFWKNDPTTDTGSLFKFEKVDFSNNNPRFYQLSDVKATLADGTNIYGGTSIGLYTGGKEYREAYTNAAALVSAGNTSASADCYNAYMDLRSASKNLSYNEVDENSFYFIKSVANNDYCKGKYVYTCYQPTTRQRGNYTGTHDHRHLIFDAVADIPQMPLAMFQFEKSGTQGQYKMKNLHTGLYIKSFAKNAEHMGSAQQAQVITIAGITDEQVTLKIGEKDPMHAQKDLGVIVQWGATPGNASVWSIDEVNDKSLIKQTVSVSSVGYSTLYLNYPVAIPDGLTAYQVGTIEDNVLKMEEISGTIPARTAVVLKGDAKSYDFVLTEEVNTSRTTAVLSGTLYKQRMDKKEGFNYYVLAYVDTTPDDGVDNKKVGFYQAVNSEAPNTFINAANKAYLQVSPSEHGISLAFLGFDFDDDQETGIIETENGNVDGENAVIFDLQGRRLQKVNKSGIYIVNGKKVLVK